MPPFVRALRGVTSSLLAAHTRAVIVLATLVASAHAGAQERQDTTSPDLKPPVSGHGAAATLHAARTTARIVIDGRPDDPAWSEASPITTFTQDDPYEGKPASERTIVRILFDDEAVYVAATLADRYPVSLRLARRDANFTDSDVFAVQFDSQHDHQTAYRFVINASGVKRDETVSSTGGGGGDTSWDPVWDGRTAVTDSGWTVEMRIPLSQLRFQPGDSQTWGLQLERRIARNQEHDVYAFTPKKQRGGPPRFAHLDGVRVSAGAHRLELLPYVLTSADYRAVPLNASVNFANPFRGRSAYRRGAGGDFKFRITSNVTLNGTVNPDFGQVEADPALINLTAFETRLDERRPFFVEGADIFRFGSSFNRGTQLLYSRRVGRAPQGDGPDSAAYVDAPSTATIIGAAKVTGRTANGWSFGMLEAVTDRERVASVGLNGSNRETEIEPVTSYFAARAKHSSASGFTSAGGILSAVNRKLDDPSLAAALRSSAYVAGADYRHEWGNRDYAFSAEATSSLVDGTASALLRTQRSAVRFFQRPDASHLTLDSSATSLRGYASYVAIGKFGGSWQRNARAYVTSPGFEVNDLGFQTAADRRGVNTDFSYRDEVPGRHLRRWDVSTDPEASWNFAGDRVGGHVAVNASATRLDLWTGSVSVDLVPVSLDDRLTRGGPLARRPGERGIRAGISSGPLGRISFNAGANLKRSDGGGMQSKADVGVTLRPTNNVEIRVAPELERSRVIGQYVTSVDDRFASSTFGRRYLFATLDQATLSMGLRTNIAMSPTLTFESFVQPFVSSGKYGTLKELSAPRTFDFTRYGVDAGTMTRDTTGVFIVDPDGAGPAPSFSVRDRDYSYRSLRGNAVLRWEWRAGSTLFLVWQQNRELNRTAQGEFARDSDIGRFDPYGAARGLFALAPQNFLQLKVTYWLNP
jgi:hypothetical protein